MICVCFSLGCEERFGDHGDFVEDGETLVFVVGLVVLVAEEEDAEWAEANDVSLKMGRKLSDGILKRSVYVGRLCISVGREILCGVGMG